VSENIANKVALRLSIRALLAPDCIQVFVIISPATLRDSP
jgi:hypothetical protein